MVIIKRYLRIYCTSTIAGVIYYSRVIMLSSPGVLSGMENTFTCEQISKEIGWNVLSWNNNKTINCFTNRISQASEGSLCFLFEKYDGEDYLISRMIEYKASGVVVGTQHNINCEKWSKAGIGVLQAANLETAFLNMARLYRSKFDIPVIQVIGSSGKTTTKDMIGAVLNHSLPALVGIDNLNAPMGVAINISRLRDFHKAAVFEAGMKSKGMLKLSSSILSPTIGVVTCIHRSHFTTLGSIEEIISAKSEILQYLSSDGFLLINGEDVNCSKLPLGKYKGKILTFGFSNKCDIWASEIICNDLKTNFKVHYGDIEFVCTIGTVGTYNVLNALTAVMIGLKLGIKPENIAKGLSNFKPYFGRLEVYNGIKGTTLINDNFNANPDNTRMLLADLPSFSHGRPVILVMGDMENPREEISDYARKVHYEIGQQIGSLNVGYLFAIGKWAEEYVKGAASSGMPGEKLFYFKDVDAAADRLVNCLIPGCIVLFKGSVTYVHVSKLIGRLI